MDPIRAVKQEQYTDISIPSPARKDSLIVSGRKKASILLENARNLFGEYKESASTVRFHGGWMQLAGASTHSIGEVARMRKGLKKEAFDEFRTLVREFNRIAPGVQKETQHGYCNDTAEATYQRMKTFMSNENNNEKIKHWEVAYVNDAGAHFSVLLLPKESALAEGKKPESNSLPLGSEISPKRKEFAFGAVLESSLFFGRGSYPTPDHGSWAVYGYRDWDKHGPCSFGRQKRVYIEKIWDGENETKYSARKVAKGHD